MAWSRTRSGISTPCKLSRRVTPRSVTSRRAHRTPCNTLQALKAGCTEKRDEGGLTDMCTEMTLIPTAIHDVCNRYIYDTYEIH
eukprot:5479941-Prymnesium_polylepis.1